VSFFRVLHFIYCYAEFHCAERHYAECRYAQCHYAECRYAKCRFAVCRGTFMVPVFKKEILNQGNCQWHAQQTFFISGATVAPRHSAL
jgi:hypothetical protein